MSSRHLSVLVALVLAAVIAAPAAATPPGKNGLLIWQRETQNTLPRLQVANPDGSGKREVFKGGSEQGEVEGTFSPTDPNLVFFTRFSAPPFSEDIFSGNLATAEVTRVRRARSADIAPTVSPDGNLIAYFAIPRPARLDPDVPPPPERIHVMGVDGGDDHVLTPRGQSSFDPDWSPDGTRIVYAQTRLVGPKKDRPQNRLAIMNADGSDRHAITAYGGVSEVNPKWAPDGLSIVFEQLRQRGNRSDIAAISPDGGPVRKILATKAWETNPVPSPDGTRIVFTSDRDRRGPERLGPGFEIYTMAIDGSDIVRVTNNRKLDLFPDWQRLP